MCEKVDNNLLCEEHKAVRISSAFTFCGWYKVGKTRVQSYLQRAREEKGMDRGEVTSKVNVVLFIIGYQNHSFHATIFVTIFDIDKVGEQHHQLAIL